MGEQSDKGGSTPPSDLTKAVRDVLEEMRNQSGSGAQNLRPALVKDVLATRRKLEASEAEVAELKKKVAPEGAVILTGDDAKAWTEAGLTGKKLKDSIARLTTLEEEKKKRDHDDTVAAVAEALEWDQKKLLKLRGIEGMKFEIREEKDGEEKKKVPYVTTAEGKQAQRFAEYVDEEFGEDFIDFLRVSGNGEPARPTRSNQQPLEWTPQKKTGSNAPKVLSEEDIEKRKVATGEYASM